MCAGSFQTRNFSFRGRFSWESILLGILFMGPLNSQAESENISFKPEERTHWALQKVTRPALPAVSRADWKDHPIDRFIYRELNNHKLEPSEPADKITLLRRATLDLIGLPPTPTEVDAFLDDRSANAFEKVVDRLLRSSHYGERWARHWLDLARYAESEGFKEDAARPNIWRYRDYVIQSFNSDKPYDRFIQEQIAGDELWPDDPEARIATGFNRHYPDEHNARDLKQRRQEILNDITDTVGAVFTGLTYACARCHNHKFDPILQSDYYRLQAFFANVSAADQTPLLKPAELRMYREELAGWEEKTREIREAMAAIEAPRRREIEEELIEKYPKEIQEAIAKAPAERTSLEWLMYYKARQYLDPESYQYVAPVSAVLGKLKPDVRKQWDDLKQRLDGYQHLHPGKLPMASGMEDVSDMAPSTHVLFRGSYEKPKEEVQPGFLQILDPGFAKSVADHEKPSTGRRSALAAILINPANPLTARVMANRLWHYHFGKGLVATPSDFGLKGSRPTHPELLDWLASEFVENGWSMKRMHRLIMTSRAYQQSSGFREKANRIDPDDQWLWRFPRLRLEGEVIRDSALAVSGLLNSKMGGPSIFPELPPGMAARSGWKTTADETERNRRSIYVFVKRNSRYPLFESFDMPDTHESCSRRNVTTTPLQALHMLNSELTLKWAQYFAGRVIETSGSDWSRQVDAAFRFALCRKPDAAEKYLAEDFFRRQRAVLEERISAGKPVALPPDLSGDSDMAAAATLVDFCHMLVNANEFVYRN